MAAVQHNPVAYHCLGLQLGDRFKAANAKMEQPRASLAGGMLPPNDRFGVLLYGLCVSPILKFPAFYNSE